MRSPRKQSGDADSTKSERDSQHSLRSAKSNRSSLKDLMASSDVQDLTQYKEDTIEDWDDIRVISPKPTVMNIDFSDSDDDWVTSPVKVVASAGRSGKPGKSGKSENGKKEKGEMQTKETDSDDDWETAEEKVLSPPRSKGSLRAPNRTERRRRGSMQTKASKEDGEKNPEGQKATAPAVESGAKPNTENKEDSDEEWEESTPVAVAPKSSDQWDDDSDEWEDSKPVELAVKPPKGIAPTYWEPHSRH